MAIYFVAVISVATHFSSGVQVDKSSYADFLHRNEDGGHTSDGEAFAGLSSLPPSLDNFGVAGIAHWPNSLFSVTRNVTRINSVAAAVPANRQQMYFRPVSTTLQCVMVLTIVSLLLYTALSISRNTDELSGAFAASLATETLTMGSRVGNLAPMMCMLFVACRMYVLATTEGLGEPPAWVKTCMWLGVCGFGLQLLVVLTLPQFTRHIAHDEAQYDMTFGKADKQKDAARARALGEEEEQEEPPATRALMHATGDQNDAHPALNTVEFTTEGESMKSLFWFLQIASIVLVYLGVAGVVFGVATYPAQSTKISAAVLCTICMSVLYFSVTLILWVARALPESENSKGQLSALTEASLHMSSVARKAPMFAVLFLASRMRALNIDPPYGMPPIWMQCLFYIITALLYVETIAAAVVGATGKMKKAYYGVYTFSSQNKPLVYIQYAAGIIPYGCLIPIIIGVIFMRYPDGSIAPLSTTLKSVITLGTAYFGVMCWQSVVMLREEISGEDRTIYRDASIAAGISLGLAPFLSILFVATRMRALQITQQRGAPPGWAQDCMNIAVFTCCVQAICCLLMPIFTSSACRVDDHGNPDYDNEPMIGAYALAVLKYVMLMALHGSIITICIAVYVMTPDTAHDGGRFVGSAKSLFKMMAITLAVFFVALLCSSAKVVGMAIKLAIEACDEEVLGVNITIKNVALNAFQGYVKIQNFVLHNPEEEMQYKKGVDGKLTGEKVKDKDGSDKKCEWECDCVAEVKLLLIKINLWRLASTLGKVFELQNLSIVGIHFNYEKPSVDSNAQDSNLDYITNFLEANFGPETPAKAEESPAKVETPAKVEAPAKVEDTASKDEEKVEAPKIIVHKIELGDIGVKVLIRNVPVIPTGRISFNPGIGVIEFDDVQQDVFGGKENLTGPEATACIVKALVTKIIKAVVLKLPEKMAEIASQKFHDVTKGCAAGVTKILSKQAPKSDEKVRERKVQFSGE